MKVLAILLLLASVAVADPKAKPAAEAWLAAMTGSGAAPALRKPLTYGVQSDQCPKLTRGKASSAAELATLKACFVATWTHVAKEATLVVEDIKLKALDGEQLRWNKTAPKGTSWVRASRSYAGQDLAVRIAVGPDHAVLAVWFVYTEHDGE